MKQKAQQSIPGFSEYTDDRSGIWCACPCGGNCHAPGRSYTAAAHCCHGRCRCCGHRAEKKYRFSFHKSCQLLPQKLAEELDGLNTGDQFELLCRRFAKQNEEFNAMSVERLLGRLLADNSHTQVVENLGSGSSRSCTARPSVTAGQATVWSMSGWRITNPICSATVTGGCC